MKFFIFLVTIAITSAEINNKNDCGIVVNDIVHEKEILMKNVDKPYQLAIDYDANRLYFSYTTIAGDVFDLACLNLVKTNGIYRTGKIRGVEGGFANSVDEKSHIIFFGGSNGLYQLETNSTKAIYLNITNKNIWQLFYKDGLYFTTYPNEEAFVYKNGEVNRVTEIGETRVMLIGVDNAYNIIFSNNSGLFYFTKDDNKTAYLGDYIVNGITNDIKGNIFFSTPTGIYSFSEKTKEVKILAKYNTNTSMIINMFYGLAIESDGSIIYASGNSIIRLKSAGNGMECFT